MRDEGEDETVGDVGALRRLMRARFSCRAFRPDPVDEATIETIVETARWSASWSNVQPWEVIVTRPSTTARLAEALVAAARAGDGVPDIPYPRSYSASLMARRREVGFGLYAALGIAREDRAARHEHHLANFRFFGAPHVALITAPEELGTYGVLDIGGFVGAFLLAARAAGVDTLAQAALAQQSGLIRAFFDIPPDRQFVCGIAFGHAQPEHPANRFRSTRAELAEFLRFA